jgi:hypothetical protein
MKRLDEKLRRIRAGQYGCGDFVLADAKDPDMGPGLAATGPRPLGDDGGTRLRTRGEFLEEVRAIVRQDIIDVMLLSASNLELLTDEGLFDASAVTPAIRANDTTDTWRVRGGNYHEFPSRPFRSALLARVMFGTAGAAPAGAPLRGTDLGLYSITFNNDVDADVATLEAFARFRADAAAIGFKYFLEVFNPNVDARIDPKLLPSYVNDCIVRCLAGVTKADRPQFLKMVYNGSRALEELASFDQSLIVGVLGGSAGTTRDTFELVAQAERHGARVALFGRKINLAESPLAIIALMRQVANHVITPIDAVKAYHAELDRRKLRSLRTLEDDLTITEAVLKAC